MREVHERDGDDADTGPDSSPEAAAGNRDDPRRPAIAIIRDSATRTALALEYRQRAEGKARRVRRSGHRSYRRPGDRAHRMPAERGHAPDPPPGRDTAACSDDPCGEAARPEDMARPPARKTDLPVSARELPNAADVLPNLEKAEIDERKFSEYSMNPGHPDNQGKANGWRALGYDVDNPEARQKAARELRDLTLEELLANGKVAKVREDSYGSRPQVINGIAGPNGKHATMVTCWLIEDLSGTAIPRLITTWVEPHRDKEAGQ